MVKMNHSQHDLICFNQTTIAHDDEHIFFLDKHASHEGTWSYLQLTSGEINVVFTDTKKNLLKTQYLTPATPPLIIPPATMHSIDVISNGFTAKLDFYCKPHRYFNKKHGLGEVHNDLLYCYNTYFSQAGSLKVLDVGCGTGRNALFMKLLGHEVTALDINRSHLEHIEHISLMEGFQSLQTQYHDLNSELQRNCGAFDFIISTVSLQFLKPERVPVLLSELRDLTHVGGRHLLVYPIASNIFSLPETFTYLAEKEELLCNYQDAGWSILEYRENVGRLHRNDASGRPIQGLFAFLLVEKPL